MTEGAVERHAARWCLALGAGVLVLAVVSTVAARPAACGDLDPSYAPILAFELARSTTDLQRLFGASDDACRRTLLATLHAANLGDVALFIPLYTSFIAAFFVARRSVARRWASAGIALAAFIAAADCAENVCLFALESALDDPATPWLPRLVVTTSLKWLALGTVAVIAGLAARGLGWPSRLAASGAVAGAFSPALAVVDPNRFGRFIAAGVGLSWAAMLVVAAAVARRTVSSRNHSA